VGSWWEYSKGEKELFLKRPREAYRVSWVTRKILFGREKYSGKGKGSRGQGA